MINLPPPAGLDAIRSGSVDAILENEPFLTRHLEADTSTIWADGPTWASDSSSRCCTTEAIAVGTVDRVLPWRRQNVEVANSELTPLLASYRRRHPKSPVSTISRAYRVAADAHQSQMRSSGESYINHPLAVAQIVADIGLD